MTTKKIVGIVVGLIVLVSLLIPMCNIKNDENTLNVVIIDGQSNGAYWSICDPTVVQQEYDVTPIHNLYYYGTSDTPIQYNKGDYDKTFESYEIYSMWDNGWKIGGYEPILANELSNRSDRDTLIINIAISGASVSKLEPTGDGGRFGFLAIDDALSKIDGYDSINMVGWIWIQGETDKNMSVLNYEYGFSNLMLKFDSIGLKHCYVVGVRDSWGGNSQIALRDIANSNPNVTFVTDIAETFTESNGCLNPGDPIHFSQKGRNEIAKILGEEIPISKFGNTPDTVRTFVELIPIIAIVGFVSLICMMFVNKRT